MLTWLALGYNVPVQPSKNRVYVWRKLKECGAGYFRPGVALLPKSGANMAIFRQLSGKIQAMGGDATIAELRFVDQRDESETIERFRSQSESEYSELLRDCANVLDGLRRGLRGSEERDHLKKYARRYRQVQSRDYFKVRERSALKSALDELARDIGDLF